MDLDLLCSGEVKDWGRCYTYVRCKGGVSVMNLGYNDELCAAPGV